MKTAAALLLTAVLFAPRCFTANLEPALRHSNARASLHPGSGKGLAVVVGVERVNGETEPSLATSGSGRDALAFAEMLERKGYDPSQITTLITASATKANVARALENAQVGAGPEDIVVFYFSGHGGQVDDVAPNRDEGDDRKDETLVCFDGNFIDDELYSIFQRFAPGCRIVFINDACNSGTTFKFNSMRALMGMVEDTTLREQGMSFNNESARNALNAQLIYMGGASDGLMAHGDEDGGRYTQQLLRMLNHPIAPPSYRALHERLSDLLQPRQVPSYHEVGPVRDPFNQQPPFTISLP